MKKIEFLLAFKKELISAEMKAFNLLNDLNLSNSNILSFVSHHQAIFASTQATSRIDSYKAALQSASQFLFYPPEYTDLSDACEKMKMHYEALSKKHAQLEKDKERNPFTDFTLQMIKNFILHLDEAEKEILEIKKHKKELMIITRMRSQIAEALFQYIQDFEKENWAYSSSKIPFYFTEADVSFAINYIDQYASHDIKKRIDAYALLENRFSVHLIKQTASLLPSQLIESDSVHNIEIRNQLLIKQAKKLMADQKELNELSKKIVFMQSSNIYKKSWFQRLANRVARFVGIDPRAKKSKQLKLLNKQYSDKISAYDAEKAIYEKRKSILLDDAHLISDRLISVISDDLDKTNSSQSSSELVMRSEKIKKMRGFISEYADEKSDEFESKLNFVTTFFKHIGNGVSLDELSAIAQKIQICQPDIYPIIDKILLLLQGEYLYRNVAAIKTHVHTAYDHTYQSGEQVNCIVKSITENYLPALIFQDIQKNYLLLQYYSQSEKSTLFSKHIEMRINLDEIINTEKALSYFCHIAEFYKEADHYQAIRDDALKTLFNHIDFSSVNQHDLEYLIDMTKKTLQKDEPLFSIISLLSDAIVNHIRSLPPESEWNSETATIVESYCSDETIKQTYRTKGLEQLIKTASNQQSFESCETEWISFLEIHKIANWKPFSLTDEQKCLVEQIATDSKPTWMHELIVKKLGTESQLQNMHARWFIKLIDLLEEGHVSPSDLSIEKVLRELCALHLTDSMSTIQKNMLFLSLVGIDNAKIIFDRFVSIVNKIKLSPADIRTCASTQIAILGGSVFEFLFNAFYEDSGVDQNFKAWAMEANAYVERLVAIHDVDNLTSEMRLLLKNMLNDEVTDKHVIDCAYVQTVLMQRPQDRIMEKHGRYSTLLAQNKVFSDFEKKENPAFDFNYANNPDVFYHHHRLPLLRDCFDRIAKSDKPHLHKEKFNKIKPALFPIKENHLALFLPYMNELDKNNFLKCDAATLSSALTAIKENNQIPEKIRAAADGLLQSIELIQKIEACFSVIAAPKEEPSEQKKSSFSCVFSLFSAGKKPSQGSSPLAANNQIVKA